MLKHDMKYSPVDVTDLTIQPEYENLIANLYDMDDTDYFLKKLRKKAKKTFRKAGDVGKTLVNVSPAGYIKRATTGKDIIAPEKFKTRTGREVMQKTGLLRQRTGQAALAATAGGLAAKKLQTVGPTKKIGPAETGQDLVPKLVKPLKGVAEDWLPQPGDPTGKLPPRTDSKGLLGSLVGSAKDMLKQEVDKIKQNPDRVLNQLKDVIGDRLQQQIQTGLMSDNIRAQQAALDRLAAENIKAQGGPNLAGIQLGGNMTWIIIAIMVGVLLMAFVFRK